MRGFLTGSTLTIVGCICFLTWLHKQECKKWLTNNSWVPVKFYSREICKAAHELSNDDDLECQAADIIKSIEDDWIRGSALRSCKDERDV
jgi:hypothetical protein